MKANINLYWILTVFFLLLAGVYVVWSLLDPLQGSVEWVGTFGIALPSAELLDPKLEVILADAGVTEV